MKKTYEQFEALAAERLAVYESIADSYFNDYGKAAKQAVKIINDAYIFSSNKDDIIKFIEHSMEGRERHPAAYDYPEKVVENLMEYIRIVERDML